MTGNKFTWLPDFLDIDPFSAEKHKILYQHYLDLQNNRPLFNGVKIYIPFQADPIDTTKQEMFFHLTTCDYTKNKRQNKGHEKFDPQRAKRINWINPIIEKSSHEKEIEVAHEKEKCYLFIEDLRYVIVLKQTFKFSKTGQYQLVTAYFLSENWSFKKIKKKFS